MTQPQLPAKPLTALLALSALAACSAPAADPEAALDSTSQAVINGVAEPTAMPFTAGQKLAVGFLTIQEGGQGWRCTGTVVSPRVVVTAKHCTESGGRPISTRSVVFGLGQAIANPIATFDVEAIHNHASRDVSVMVLTDPVTAEVREVEPVPFRRAALGQGNVGEQVQIGGFGQTRNPSTEEQKWWAALEIAYVNPQDFIVYGGGQRGFCFGDSGGPVFTQASDGTIELGAVISATEDQTCLGLGFVERTDTLASWLDPIIEATQPADPCDGLDYLGACDGDIARWCDNGNLFERDCGALGTSCGYVDGQVGYTCNCEGLPSGGECEGTLARTCNGGRLRVEDCADRGLQCLSGDQTRCGEESPPAAECEDGEALCNGDVITTCRDGRWVGDLDCAFQGASCDLDGTGRPGCVNADTSWADDVAWVDGDPREGNPSAWVDDSTDPFASPDDEPVPTGDGAGAITSTCTLAAPAARPVGPAAALLLGLAALITLARRRR